MASLCGNYWLKSRLLTCLVVLIYLNVPATSARILVTNENNGTSNIAGNGVAPVSSQNVTTGNSAKVDQINNLNVTIWDIILRESTNLQCQFPPPDTKNVCQFPAAATPPSKPNLKHRKMIADYDQELCWALRNVSAQICRTNKLTPNAMKLPQLGQMDVCDALEATFRSGFVRGFGVGDELRSFVNGSACSIYCGDEPGVNRSELCVLLSRALMMSAVPPGQQHTYNNSQPSGSLKPVVMSQQSSETHYQNEAVDSGKTVAGKPVAKTFVDPSHPTTKLQGTQPTLTPSKTISSNAGSSTSSGSLSAGSVLPNVPSGKKDTAVQKVTSTGQSVTSKVPFGFLQGDLSTKQNSIFKAEGSQSQTGLNAGDSSSFTDTGNKQSTEQQKPLQAQKIPTSVEDNAQTQPSRTESAGVQAVSSQVVTSGAVIAKPSPAKDKIPIPPSYPDEVSDVPEGKTSDGDSGNVPIVDDGTPHMSDNDNQPDYSENDIDFDNGASVKPEKTNKNAAGELPAPQFPEYTDSHFFTYFLTVVVLCIIVYLVFHNKQKIIALIIEGRHERRRRPSTANYKKLDCNLEEVMQGGTKGVTTAHVIY